MQQIVPGVEPNHLLDAFFAALCMYTDTLEVCDRCTFQESEIRIAKYGELSKRFLGVGLAIA